jgi:hypothetical protein
MEPTNYDIIKKKVFPGVMITTLINNEDLPPRFF